jgi:hypothetical protein
VINPAAEITDLKTAHAAETDTARRAVYSTLIGELLALDGLQRYIVGSEALCDWVSVRGGRADLVQAQERISETRKTLGLRALTQARPVNLANGKP